MLKLNLKVTSMETNIHASVATMCTRITHNISGENILGFYHT